MKKLIAWILIRYTEANLQILRKSRILAIALLFFIGITLPFGGVMMGTGAFVVGVLLFAFSVLCLAMVLILRSGRFKVAGTFLLISLFVVMFAAIKGDQYIDVYECYVFGTLGIFLLVTSAMVGIAVWQPLLLTFLDLAAIAALYILDSLPLQGWQVAALDVQSLVTSSLMVIMSGIFAAISIRLQNTLIQRAEGEARINRDQFRTMDAAISEAQAKTGELSIKIRDAMAGTIESADGLNEVLSGIRSCIEKLNRSLNESSEQNKLAMSHQNAMKENIVLYTRDAHNASLEVKEMAQRSRLIDEAARSRQASVGKLVSLAVEGERRLTELKATIDGITKKASRIEELSGLIGDVAQRTNMLGMNASIEAAHAGTSGKGFAVVAGQIRILSEEATKNTKTIGESLEDTRRGIQSTVLANNEATNSFRNITQEIHGVAAMLDELLKEIPSITKGAESVFRSVDSVYSLSLKTGEIVDASHARIESSSAEIEEVIKSAEQFAGEIEKMTEKFAQLRKEAEDVRQLGSENAEYIEKIRRDLDSIRLASK